MRCPWDGPSKGRGQDAIGTVRAVGSGVATVAVGERVFCDSYVEEPAADGRGERAFMGCFAISAGGGRVLSCWPDGSFAQKMLVPVDCVTAVGAALPTASADTLSRIGWLGTAYSAFTKTGFRAGQSVAVLGATGVLGTSAVLLALALGASRVLAIGRSAERLRTVAVDPRVEPTVEPPGADAPVDLVINALHDDGHRLIERSLKGIARNGSLVMLASPATPPTVSGLVTKDITVRGSLWFDRDVPARLVTLISAGTLDLSPTTSVAFPLDRLGEAMAHRPVTPFQQVVINP